MSKVVIFMRHGKADDIFQFFGDDFKRNLVEDGIEQTANAALELKNQHLIPEIIIHSSANRTTQTAEKIVETLELNSTVLQAKNELYNSSTSEYIEAVNNCDKNIILIVGHNPMVGTLASIFSNREIYNFPTSSWAAFSYENKLDENAKIEFKAAFIRK